MPFIIPTPSGQASRRGSFGLEEMKGRKNRAFLAVKQELAEREKIKRKKMKAAKKKKGKMKQDPQDEVGNASRLT